MQLADSSAPMHAKLLLSGVWSVLSCDSIPASSRLSELYTFVMRSFGRALSILRVNLPTWSLSKRLTLSALIQSLLSCSALDFKRGLPFSASLALFFVASRAHLCAVSLPLMPSCPGTHWSVTLVPWV